MCTYSTQSFLRLAKNPTYRTKRATQLSSMPKVILYIAPNNPDRGVILYRPSSKSNAWLQIYWDLKKDVFVPGQWLLKKHIWYPGSAISPCGRYFYYQYQTYQHKHRRNMTSACLAHVPNFSAVYYGENSIQTRFYPCYFLDPTDEGERVESVAVDDGKNLRRVVKNKHPYYHRNIPSIFNCSEELTSSSSTLQEKEDTEDNKSFVKIANNGLVIDTGRKRNDHNYPDESCHYYEDIPRSRTIRILADQHHAQIYIVTGMTTENNSAENSVHNNTTSKDLLLYDIGMENLAFVARDPHLLSFDA